MLSKGNQRFPRLDHSDRNAVLGLVALVWLGLISGFGTDSLGHLRAHGLDYPFIVHVHAVVFFGFVALFTAQVFLIRSGKAALHQRLGIAGALLICLMIIIGPVTAFIVDHQAYARTGAPPRLLAIQLTTIAGFAALAGSGLHQRSNVDSHKRLMLLALCYVSDAGFARFVNKLVSNGLVTGFLADFTTLYFTTDALILSIGTYDLVTRHRLNRAYLAGTIGIFSLEIASIWLMHDPGWNRLSLRLIGY